MGYTYSDFPNLPAHKTWAEIDLAALRRNYRTLCSFCPGQRHIAVVKADAYGHGAGRCVNALMEEGCTFFAVSSIEEAIAVRAVCSPEAGEVLILGYTLPDEAALLAQYGILQTVFSVDYAAALSRAAAKAGVRLRVHVKLDTGMNRLGFSTLPGDVDDTAAQIAVIAADPNLALCGLFTHFARADERDPAPIYAQFARYTAIAEQLDKLGSIPACATSATALPPAGSRLGGWMRCGLALCSTVRRRHGNLAKFCHSTCRP